MGILLRAKAKHVSGGDRAGRDAENVAYDTADARVCAAKRLQGRGMIMGFHLKREVEVVIKGDDARIIDKGRAQPVGSDGFGSGANIAVEEAVDCFMAHESAVGILPGEVDFGAKGLVDAMF